MGQVARRIKTRGTRYAECSYTGKERREKETEKEGELQLQLQFEVYTCTRIQGMKGVRNERKSRKKGNRTHRALCVSVAIETGKREMPIF